MNEPLQTIPGYVAGAGAAGANPAGGSVGGGGVAQRLRREIDVWWMFDWQESAAQNSPALRRSLASAPSHWGQLRLTELNNHGR